MVTAMTGAEPVLMRGMNRATRAMIHANASGPFNFSKKSFFCRIPSNVVNVVVMKCQKATSITVLTDIKELPVSCISEYTVLSEFLTHASAMALETFSLYSSVRSDCVRGGCGRSERMSFDTGLHAARGTH